MCKTKFLSKCDLDDMKPANSLSHYFYRLHLTLLKLNQSARNFQHFTNTKGHKTKILFLHEIYGL